MVQLFQGIKVDWLGKRKMFCAISIVLMLIGMGSLIFKGNFDYGLDFKGGTMVRVRFKQPTDIGAVRDLLPQANIQTIRRPGVAEPDFQIELGNASADPGVSVDATLGREQVTAALNTKFSGQFDIVASDGVSPKVGEDLRRQAVNATVLALLGILVYIALRFEPIYGAAAVFAVFHDALVTLGFFSLFNYEINLTVIAALLTLVGYSVNDTIVVFDRVRENLKTRRRDDLEDVLNDSLNQTFSRTILTSLLTLIAVLALFLFGGENINNFAFAMVIGVIVGSYSSIAIAAPLVLIYARIRGPKLAAKSR